MDEERCPGCKGLIIDGVCPFCTSPIPGLSTSDPLEPDSPRVPVTPRPKGVVPRVVTGVLVLALGICWLAFAGLQIRVAMENRPGPGAFILCGLAVPSLFAGTYNCLTAVAMFRRSYQVQGRLVLASVVGMGWGLFTALLFESQLLSAFIPLHALMGVFAVLGSRYFERDFV